MKRIVSFLYSITLFTSLNSMEGYLPIPLLKICNCSYKRKDNAIKTLNLDSVPPELIVTYIFPALDTIDCDYELMKLINNYGACYKGQEEQQEKYSNIFSMSIVPLITLSIVNKKLRTNVVIEEIKQRILPFKFTHVSLNSIYKYLKDDFSTKNFYNYFLENCVSISSINVCTLNANKWDSKCGFYNALGINYRSKLLVKDFKLHINLIKKIPETFIFRDESLYNCLYEFCQFIATEYSDDQYIVNSCEHLKKECLTKKELNIETIKYFIHFLNSN